MLTLSLIEMKTPYSVAAKWSTTVYLAVSQANTLNHTLKQDKSEEIARCELIILKENKA